MTTMEIAAEHGVSRQSIHTYRRTGAFPQPVEEQGSTRVRFREDEVAAFFEANPKQPGKKRSSPPEQGEPVTTTVVDPRIRQLAEARQRVGHEAYGSTANWNSLKPDEQQLFLDEAASWLRAAVEAGLMPPAERPTDRHMAVYLDEEGLLYGEYDGDDILRLVWVSEQAQSKRELEERGAEFRLLGWSE
ncbi:helix-turn-helix transcriptional regulator [Streptomyces prunicolor]